MKITVEVTECSRKMYLTMQRASVMDKDKEIGAVSAVLPTGVKIEIGTGELVSPPAYLLNSMDLFKAVKAAHEESLKEQKT